LKKGDLLRQQKNPDRLCMRNTLRALDFFASLHLTIFERLVNFEFFNSQLSLWAVIQTNSTNKAARQRVAFFAGFRRMKEGVEMKQIQDSRCDP
jgi:hypothetical protein